MTADPSLLSWRHRGRQAVQARNATRLTYVLRLADLAQAEGDDERALRLRRLAADVLERKEGKQ